MGNSGAGVVLYGLMRYDARLFSSCGMSSFFRKCGCKAIVQICTMAVFCGLVVVVDYDGDYLFFNPCLFRW